jgi:hypothetical protein
MLFYVLICFLILRCVLQMCPARRWRCVWCDCCGWSLTMACAILTHQTTFLTWSSMWLFRLVSFFVHWLGDSTLNSWNWAPITFQFGRKLWSTDTAAIGLHGTTTGWRQLVKRAWKRLRKDTPAAVQCQPVAVVRAVRLVVLRVPDNPVTRGVYPTPECCAWLEALENVTVPVGVLPPKKSWMTLPRGYRYDQLYKKYIEYPDQWASKVR